MDNTVRIVNNLTECGIERLSNGLSAWRVTLSATTFFFYQFVQITMFNSLSQELLNDFNLTPSYLGYLSSSYFLASIASLLPAGVALDYFSTKRVIMSAMSVSMIALVMLSISTSLSVAILARFISGISGAFCFLSAVRIASRWFTEDRLAVVIGLIVSVGLIGGIIAQNPISLLVESFGWRYTLNVIALVGLVFICIVKFFVQDFPGNNSNQWHELSLAHRYQLIWKVVSKKENWLIGSYISLMNLPILVLGAMWGDRYLMKVYALNHAQAGITSSMLFVGMIIGSPVMGWISDYIKERLQPMLIAATTLSLIYLLLFCGFNLSFLELSIVFLLIGIFSSAQVLGYPLIASINSSLLIATAEGLASTIMIAGGLMQTVFGILLQSHLMFSRSAFQYGENYLLAMLIMPVGSGISILIIHRLNKVNLRSITEMENIRCY